MERQVYNISYNGLDKESRIDCLSQIRRTQNPPGSTCLDIDDLRKGSRSTKRDAAAVNEPRIPGKFVKIGEIEF